MIWQGGDLIYTDYEDTLARFNNDSEVDWINNNIGHHDVGVFNDDLLVYERRNLNSDNLNTLVEDEILVTVSPEEGQKLMNYHYIN